MQGYFKKSVEVAQHPWHEGNRQSVIMEAHIGVGTCHGYSTSNSAQVVWKKQRKKAQMFEALPFAWDTLLKL